MAADRHELGWHVAWTMRAVSGPFRVCAALLLPLLLACSVVAEPSQEHTVSELCRHHFLQQLNIIDGATLHSRNERNLDCKLTFQTQSMLQRFMVRFDSLQLDCNDHLYIHDGAHAIDGKYKADLSCRDTKKSVGTLFTRSNHLTLEYRTDAWGTERNGFKMVITAFKHVNKDLVVDCDEFLCGDHCISKDLRCDGVVHCVDGVDESVTAGCVDTDLVTMFGMDETLFLGACAGAAVVALMLVITVIVCLCRRRRHRHPRNNGTLNNTYQMSSVNCNSDSNGTRALGVTSGSEKAPLTTSENWHHPALGTGPPLSNSSNTSRTPRCSPSKSKRPAPTATRVDKRTSGSCEAAAGGRSLRRGACFASLSRHAHATILSTCARALCDVIAASFSAI